MYWDRCYKRHLHNEKVDNRMSVDECLLIKLFLLSYITLNNSPFVKTLFSPEDQAKCVHGLLLCPSSKEYLTHYQ